LSLIVRVSIKKLPMRLL